MTYTILPDGTMNTRNAVAYLASQGVTMTENQLQKSGAGIKRKGKLFFNEELLNWYFVPFDAEKQERLMQGIIDREKANQDDPYELDAEYIYATLDAHTNAVEWHRQRLDRHAEKLASIQGSMMVRPTKGNMIGVGLILASGGGGVVLAALYLLSLWG